MTPYLNTETALPPGAPAHCAPALPVAAGVCRMELQVSRSACQIQYQPKIWLICDNWQSCPPCAKYQVCMPCLAGSEVWRAAKV